MTCLKCHKPAGNSRRLERLQKDSFTAHMLLLNTTVLLNAVIPTTSPYHSYEKYMEMITEKLTADYDI